MARKHDTDPDVSDAPVAAVTTYDPVPRQVAPRTVPPLSPEEQAELQTLYDELKPKATDTAREYVLARTPAKWQVDMTALIDADWPLPDPPVLLDAQQAQQAKADADAKVDDRRY